MQHSHEEFSAACIGLQGLTAPLHHSKSAPTSPTVLLWPILFLTSNPKTEVCLEGILLLACFRFVCASFDYVQTPMQS